MQRSYRVEQYMRHLREFCKASRGPVLAQAGEARRVRYRFIDALMQPFVILDGLAKGKLPLELLLQDKTERVH